MAGIESLISFASEHITALLCDETFFPEHSLYLVAQKYYTGQNTISRQPCRPKICIHMPILLSSIITPKGSRKYKTHVLIT